MKLTGFAARADIVGRRVRIAWNFVPEGVETLADIPPVSIRRKLRDFAFPVPAASDPYLVYDSASFPPAPAPGLVAVTDLPSWQASSNGSRTLYQAVSVAVPTNGRMMEVLRRTVGTVYDSSGTPVQQYVEILDAGQNPGDLQPNSTYYYQLLSRNLPASGSAAEPYRSSAMVTDTYGLNRTFYQFLPEIYRRHDVQAGPTTSASAGVPEASPRHGQLRRFTDLFGVPLDSLRGTAEGLRTLHDLDRVDARFLPAISQWLGWQLSLDSEIPLDRNEIKSAPRLYRLVGTIPGMRALVSQYTGWFTQVAEFAQNLVLSNRPPQRNIFAITPNAVGGGWRGVDDAAELLGFGATHQDAIGSAGLPATLTGAATEPFALRPGMKLTVSVDGLLPETVSFGTADFADITHATASEAAAAINAALSDITASASGGQLVLSSDTVGEQSAIEITADSSSLISLETAPVGRLSPVIDSSGMLRLFYEAWETPTRPESLAPAGGIGSPSTAGNYVLRRIHYKTLVDGAWRDSHPVFPQSVTPEADPAALLLPDGRYFVAWVDNPQTAAAQLRFALGSSRTPVPASLLGQRHEPFALTDKAVLTLVGDWAGADRYTVHSADFANLAQATATEVQAAMNAQLTKAVASIETNGSIRIDTIAGGPQARIAVDLSQSTTARALGFDARNAPGAPGSWSEEIDWSAALDAVSIVEGEHAEVAAINDPAGGVRVAWACHCAGTWRIDTAHWSDQILAGTAGGLFLRAGTAAWAAIGGLPSTDIRGIELDPDGAAWIATSAGVSLRHSDGSIAPLTPALPSPDVRSVRLGRDGTAWMATAAGVSMRTAAGVLTNLTTADGLPSNDVRALAVCADGSVWIATAGGLALRQPSGTILSFAAVGGIPSNDIRDVAVDFDGTVYIATAAGLAVRSGGAFSTLAAADVLGSLDVRALAIGDNATVWAATARGVSRRLAGVWTIFDTASGLPSDDARAVSLGSDGAAWVGTAGGLNTIAADGTVSAVAVVGGGGPTPAPRAIQTGWSAPLELASGGGSNREPALALDATNRTWLIWSNLAQAADPNDVWALHYRIFDPLARAWGAETALTSPPGGGRSADRAPTAVPIAGGLRVYFSSDRNGSFGLWSVDITLGGVISPLVNISDVPSSDWSPSPAAVAGAPWLFYRSDRNVALTQARSMHPLHSERVPDNGTVRRYAGSVSAVLGDVARIATGRSFDDLLCYTPNRPDAVGQLSDDELYTRGTIGLYVSRANQGSALTQQEASRLRALLDQFMPINLRAVVIVVAPADAEFVYPAGADIQESYNDVYPFADALAPITDSAAAAMPSLTVMMSNTAGNISANTADLTTLHRRTFFPPIQ